MAIFRRARCREFVLDRGIELRTLVNDSNPFEIVVDADAAVKSVVELVFD
jgi:hypothetical protein